MSGEAQALLATAALLGIRLSLLWALMMSVRDLAVPKVHLTNLERLRLWSTKDFLGDIRVFQISQLEPQLEPQLQSQLWIKLRHKLELGTKLDVKSSLTPRLDIQLSAPTWCLNLVPQLRHLDKAIHREPASITGSGFGWNADHVAAWRGAFDDFSYVGRRPSGSHNPHDQIKWDVGPLCSAAFGLQFRGCPNAAKSPRQMGYIRTPDRGGNLLGRLPVPRGPDLITRRKRSRMGSGPSEGPEQSRMARMRASRPR
ncbi:hypothetical protein GGX14DRAFT_625294 [Mycena pura]|uniref:Uncharacterized protein n=1 Tax=Mycena pura TaxID=153505 RepID=A0AAD6VE01_9AGAR|nr:hypothetical protein GGX14DRAFT_625294 [Mycena pura]